MKVLHNKKFTGSGLLVTLLCCFTPVLVVLLGFAGLSAVIGYLDYGLTPLLGFFVMAFSLILYDTYKKNYIVYSGLVAVVLFSAIYFVWSNILALLVILGSFIAIITYYALFKRFCKTCVVNKK